MKTLKLKTNSFIKTCLLYLASISLIVICVSFGSMYYEQYKLASAFPTAAHVIKYEKRLKNDEFNKIPWESFKNGSAMIFDEKLDVIMTTDESLPQYITKDELWVIEKYDSNYYYIISKDYSERENYMIIQCGTDDKETYLVDQCVINQKGKIISGTLFKGKKKLSKRELNIINMKLPGYDEGLQEIEKYEYETVDGKGRTLVFVAPSYDNESYTEIIRGVRRLWPAPVFFVIMLVILLSYLFNRRIKESLQPLNDAIIHYSTERDYLVNREQIPVEFHDVIDNFEQLMKRLRDARIEKEKAEQERIRIITNLSHDLKTPLTVIQGYAKAFQDGMIPEERRDEYLDTIYHKAIYSCSMIDRLFNYVKMNNPDYTLDLEICDINEYAREYLAEKYSEIEFANAHLEVDIPETPIYAQIDFTQLGRAFDNLINNTLKYNEDGVTIYFGIKPQGGALIITVADDGARHRSVDCRSYLRTVCHRK